MSRLIEGPLTIEYPEEKTPVYPRFRGRHKLHRFEDTGLEKCVGCSLCAAACPADCIRVVAAENIPGDRVSSGERYAAVYEINLSRCIFCGYCEIACPFDAITMGHDYEMADYDRGDLIFTKEMLLAEPIERTPLKNEGEGMEDASDGSGALLHRRDRRDGRRDRRRRRPQPLLQRAGADRPPVLAGGALPAAHLGLRRRRAGGRLRGRGDGALRLRRRLRRRRERGEVGPGPRPAIVRRAPRLLPLRRDLRRRPLLRPQGPRHPRSRRPRRLRRPRRDRHPPARKVPRPLRGLVASCCSSPRSARSSSPGTAKAPRARPAGAGPDEHHLVHRPQRPALHDRRDRHPRPPQPDGDPALPRADAERRQPGAGRLQP